MITIGILGAGKVGTVLARHSTTAGYRTLIAGSGDPAAIELVVDVMSPRAVAKSAVDVAHEADIVILAIPLGKYRTLPAAHLAGKIVIDAMNYWPTVDGTIAEFEDNPVSSMIIPSELPTVRLVRAFNHLGYHQLEADARPAGDPQRHAIAIAGDEEDALAQVADLLERLGFDPVIGGDLSASARFGPTSSLFGTSTNKAEVTRLLTTSTPEPRLGELNA